MTRAQFSVEVTFIQLPIQGVVATTVSDNI